jgi:hypothetical protein
LMPSPSWSMRSSHLVKQRTYPSWPVNSKTNFRRNNDARYVSMSGLQAGRRAV